MNRRSFIGRVLGFLGIASVAPVLIAKEPECKIDVVMGCGLKFDAVTQVEFLPVENDLLMTRITTTSFVTSSKGVAEVSKSMKVHATRVPPSEKFINVTDKDLIGKGIV